jgi:Spy/CpxP family protein refolding chaperone
MKKLILLVIVFMTTIVTFAQDTLSKSPEQRTAQFVKQLKKELKLTSEQTDKIEIIQLKCLKQIDSIKVNAVAQDKKETNKKAREMTKAANIDIKAILTDDQKIKFDTWLAEKKDKTNKKAGDKENAGKTL